MYMCSLHLSIWENRSGSLWCLALFSSSSCGPAAELQQPAALLADGWPSTEDGLWSLVLVIPVGGRLSWCCMQFSFSSASCTTKFPFHLAVEFELEKYLQCPLMKYLFMKISRERSSYERFSWWYKLTHYSCFIGLILQDQHKAI